MAYLSHLVAITPTSVHAGDYAEHSLPHRRHAQAHCSRHQRYPNWATNDTDDLDTTLPAGRGRGILRQEHHPTTGLPVIPGHFRPLPAGAGQGVHGRSPDGGRTLRSCQGFADLDEVLGGVQRSDLVILAARPSVGKSTLGLNVAMNNAKSGQTCAIFSLEMTADQLAIRALAGETGIDSHRIRLGLYSSAQEERIINAIGELSELPIYVDDTPYQGMVEIRGKARRLDLDRGVDLIMVDYLQLVQGQATGEARSTGCRRSPRSRAR